MAQSTEFSSDQGGESGTCEETDLGKLLEEGMLLKSNLDEHWELWVHAKTVQQAQGLFPLQTGVQGSIHSAGEKLFHSRGGFYTSRMCSSTQA